MKLRWYIKKRRVTTWDDRKDDWNTIEYQDDPVLQMQVGKKWVTIPTVVQKAK
jgi:hypothetical protein